MSITNVLGQIWILVPVAILIVSGLVLTLRSVDIRPGLAGVARQMMGNLTSTAVYVAACLAGLLMLQSVAGFNLDTF